MSCDDSNIPMTYAEILDLRERLDHARRHYSDGFMWGYQQALKELVEAFRNRPNDEVYTREAIVDVLEFADSIFRETS